MITGEPLDALGGITERDLLINTELPHIRVDDLKPFWVRGIYEPEDPWSIQAVEKVPVRQIVASSVLGNWGDVQGLNREKLERIVGGLRSGELSPEKEPVTLFEYGGIYGIYDGQKRMMAAKLLGVESWPARVQRIMPTTLEFSKYTAVYHDIMGGRMKDGLWEGRLEEIKLDDEGNLVSSRWLVERYDGLWAFAKNMEQARDVYERLDASGQALSLIPGMVKSNHEWPM